MRPSDAAKKVLQHWSQTIDDIVILHEAYQFLLKKYVCKNKRHREGQGGENNEDDEDDEDEENEDDDNNDV